MIDKIKAHSARYKRYAIVACAIGIIILPSFMLDTLAALAIIVLALIGTGSDAE